MVNRQIVFDNLKRMQLWSESEIFADDRNNSVMYEASRCLQCGCCLEVCPNFALGGSFFGMSAMVPSSRLLAGMKGSRNRARGKTPKDDRRAYRKASAEDHEVFGSVRSWKS